MRNEKNTEIQKERRTEKKNENDAETRKGRKPVEKRNKEECQNDVEVEDGRQRNAIGNGNLRAVNRQLGFAMDNRPSRYADRTSSLRLTDGDVGIQEKRVKEGIGWKMDKVDTAEVTAEGDAKEEGEVEAMEGGNIKSDRELQEAFGNTLGFPTHRRPAESKRSMDLTSSDEEIAKWFTQDKGKDIELGEQLTETEKLQGMQLLYTWWDRFCKEVRRLPVMDVIEHQIPTIKCHPVRSKPKLSM